MAYLRFTPGEFRALCRACRRIDLGNDDPLAFQVSLLLALTDDHPALAERLASLLPGELAVLWGHLREDAGPDFTPGELDRIAAACSHSLVAGSVFQSQTRRQHATRNSLNLRPEGSEFQNPVPASPRSTSGPSIRSSPDYS